MKTQTCNKCKKIKPFNKFYKGINKNGLRWICKACDSHHSKIYGRIYYIKNKYKIQIYNRNRRFVRSEYKKKLCKVSTSFRLLNSLRARIYQVLKGNPKSLTTTKLVGCSLERLKQHLETQFKPCMSWKNYGNGWYRKGLKAWHIDHIRPCCSFNLSKHSEQKKCFHYTNLQPLWAKDNLRKHDKML